MGPETLSHHELDRRPPPPGEAPHRPGPVTRFLASVCDRQEAEIALDNGADIIDLKDPAKGALGAVDLPVLQEVIRYVDQRRPVSTTIGDQPLAAQPVSAAVHERAATGVDFVKLGLFPQGDLEGTLAALALQTRHRHALVAVMFADLDPDFGLLPRLAHAGFAGVMLDTANKQAGGLSVHLDHQQLATFVAQAQALNLFCGLAGSLRLDDIPALLVLRPDYLGFRGALCNGGRTGTLDARAIQHIARLLHEDSP